MTAELQPIIVKANVIADSQIVKAEVATEIRASGSETPTYTGEYTITPNEQTQTLETNGKRMEDNVTVEPIPSSYIIPAGIKEITQNGDHDVRAYETARVAIPSAPWSWIGKEAELLKTYQFGTLSLAETTYPSWTPSNTSSNIVLSETIDSVDADMDEYEYVIIYNHDARIVYQQETELKAAALRVCSKKAYEMHRKPSTQSSLDAGEYDYNYCSLLFGGGLTDYVDTSGERKLNWDSNFGIYISPVPVGFSYNRATNPKLIIRSPHVTARCNNTYFNTSMASKVDVDNTTITYSAELYRVKRGVVWSIYNDLVNTYRS